MIKMLLRLLGHQWIVQSLKGKMPIEDCVVADDVDNVELLLIVEIFAHAIPAKSFLICEAAVRAISMAMAINATLAIGFFDTNMCIGKESESPIGNWPNFHRKMVVIP